MPSQPPSKPKRVCKLANRAGSCESASRNYSAAFREFGVDVDQLDPAEAGKLLRLRPRSLDIAFAIDAWALIRKDLVIDQETSKRNPVKAPLYQRLVQLAQHIDDDP